MNPGTPGLLIRAPNHLGDLVMALPAIEAAKPEAVLVRRWLAPLLPLTDIGAEVIAFDTGTRGTLTASVGLRRHRFQRGVLLTPSISSALIFALGGVRQRRGTDTDARAFLLTDPVPLAALGGMHRAAGYHVLTVGDVPDPLPAPRVEVPAAARAAWAELLAQATATAAGPCIGIFPGSHAASRRWDPDRFAALARRLAAAGARVVVFGGPGERALTAEVAADAAFDAGGRTDLKLLAAGLAACDVLVTNDSGPMHLAAAVGTRTLSLQGASDPAVTGPLGAGHAMLRHTELACVPCVRNTCPRRGAGAILPHAERECLRLIEVADVERATRALLEAREPWREVIRNG